MLILPNRKIIRAKVIKGYVVAAGYDGVVVFSCGNAARALKDEGLFVVEVSPGGELSAGKWWQPAEIRRVWPDLFDATSGHLPMPLMIDIAKALKGDIGSLSGSYSVPTGSGETITCLRWAYPDVSFTPVYNIGEGTKYENEAPLNYIVNRTPELVGDSRITQL